MDKIKVGVLGTGRIAHKVCMTLSEMDGICCYAVGSRTLEKAKDFAGKYGFEKSYGSYEELANDSDVDLIYITSPHSEHLKHIELCAKHGRNIICEKAFTLASWETEKAIELARQNDVFLCEAIWPRYSPMANEISKLIQSGRLGKISHVSANLCYNSWDRERIRELSLGGGAILDLGVYCLNFVDLVLGLDFKSFTVNATMDEHYGVDRMDSLNLVYEDGATASLFFSIVSGGDRRGVIFGSEGYAVVENINCYERIDIFDNARNLLESIQAPKCISGYEYEFAEAKRCIEQGRKEAISFPLRKTVKIMQIMDAIRKEIGLEYPCDSMNRY